MVDNISLDGDETLDAKGTTGSKTNTNHTGTDDESVSCCTCTDIEEGHCNDDCVESESKKQIISLDKQQCDTCSPFEHDHTSSSKYRIKTIISSTGLKSEKLTPYNKSNNVTEINEQNVSKMTAF